MQCFLHRAVRTELYGVAGHLHHGEIADRRNGKGTVRFYMIGRKIDLSLEVT